MRDLILVVVFFSCVISYAQKQGGVRKAYFPIWTTHSKSTDIIGMSFALMSKELLRDTTLTRTYGIRIEPSVISVLFPLIPQSPISKNDNEFNKVMNKEVSEKISGVNVSTGTFGDVNINGISTCFMGQYLYRMNGIGLSLVGNFIEKQNGVLMSIGYFGNQSFKSNGVMISGIGNTSNYINGIQIGAQNYILDKGNGIQIGIYNNAKSFKGIQFGLWNKNDKRSLPIINWNFKS